MLAAKSVLGVLQWTHFVIDCTAGLVIVIKEALVSARFLAHQKD
jgi:hypothetical protein